MKRIETYAQIINGKLHLMKRSEFHKAIQMIGDCKGKLIFEKSYKKRSNDQNAYYWGVVIDLFQTGYFAETGENCTPDEAHEYLKNKFNTKEAVCEGTGEILNMVQSTQTLTTVQYEEYLIACRNFIHEYFGILVPLPNEQLEIEQFRRI